MSRSSYIPLRKKPKETGPDNYSIKKGGTDALRIDKNDIEKTIIYLKNNADVIVNEAKADTSSELDKLYTYATHLYNTESYSDFYKIIVKHFSELPDIKPGTIAAACYGCSNINGLSENLRSCAATCIDGIPPPKIPQWASCENTVALLIREGGNSYLQVLKKKDGNFAYIYMLTGESNPSARLTSGEYELLLNERIMEYHLFNYNNSYYLDMSKGVVKVPIPTLKSRGYGDLDKKDTAVVESHNNFIKRNAKYWRLAGKKQGNGQKIVFGVIFIAIFIILLVAVFRISRRK